MSLLSWSGKASPAWFFPALRHRRRKTVPHTNLPPEVSFMSEYGISLTGFPPSIFPVHIKHDFKKIKG